MIDNFKKFIIGVFITISLSACMSTGKDVFNSAKENIFSKNESDNDVGLNLEDGSPSQNDEVDQSNQNVYQRRLNIIIPAFNPGIDQEKEEMLNCSEITVRSWLDNSTKPINSSGSPSPYCSKRFFCDCIDNATSLGFDDAVSDQSKFATPSISTKAPPSATV